ncbi:MAG TPA: nuclear transport factor 2 family protein [Gaiellaceae bacterium]|nr:nuclear transport factor 2 family protein [Gaiellaceae bacterium]
MLEAYAAAVRAKDVDAFVGLYENDVRTFDLWSEWSYDGTAALRGMVAEWFGSLGTDTVAVEFDEVRAQGGSDVGGLSAFVTFKGLSAEGKQLRSMNNRLTWVLRKADDGGWRIAHEHTSAPAGEDGKVVLRR